jgi:subtilisin family serine protease
MRCVGKKPQPEIISLPTGSERAWKRRVLLLILIVPGVMACLLAEPMGSLPAAHGSDVVPLLSLTAAGKQTAPINETQAVTTGKQTANPKMASRLQHLIARRAAAKTGTGQSLQTTVQDRIKVMLHLADGATLDPKTIESRGGRVLRHRKNMVTAEIPPDQIENLIQAEQGIVFARTPHRFRPLGNVTSEGVALTGANNFHNSGYRGAGVKVAVVDMGFMKLTESINAGHLPKNVITHNFTGKGLETQYKHGTACAEIVHDMAPDAELHLLKVAEEEDFDEVRAYCLEKHIDIISLSLGTFGTGPGNGTGSFDEIFDEIRANGTLVVAAAGNEAAYTVSDKTEGTHWKGVFTDTDNDGFHEFSPGYDGIRLVSYPDFDEEGTGQDDDVSIFMRWNDWPNATTDYNLYLFSCDKEMDECNDDNIDNAVARSVGLQNGTQQPTEEIVIDLPDAPKYYRRDYKLKVKGFNSSAAKEIEISLGGKSKFVDYTALHPVATSANSIGEPADAASVFTVGAIDYAEWSSGPQEYFSSQGPTNAWAGSTARIKPDICGPDGVSSSSYTYGLSFLGTSASTPHVAGAAALVLSLHPNLLPDKLQSYLESWAVDMGISGKDNLYGWGRLHLRLPLKGDLNDSGAVDLADAIIAERVLSRWNTAGFIIPDYATSGVDVNGDNVVGLQEAIWILQFLANLR